jgi:hypothetical protein
VTRLVCGSHLYVLEVLEPYGEAGIRADVTSGGHRCNAARWCMRPAGLAMAHRS